ncbi:hypothetical protein [Bacillus bombysepticus]|uniref:hypothetical protein n=1 Tax=Bacillus bombysepticus TaxID=658666 RepID=UPI00301A6114
MISIPEAKLDLVKKMNKESVIRLRKKEKVRQHVESLRELPVDELNRMMDSTEKLLDWYQAREKKDDTLESYEEWTEEARKLWIQVKMVNDKIEKVVLSIKSQDVELEKRV